MHPYRWEVQCKTGVNEVVWRTSLIGGARESRLMPPVHVTFRFLQPSVLSSTRSRRATRPLGMAGNESMLDAFFRSLQVLDPTNYIAPVPQEPVWNPPPDAVPPPERPVPPAVPLLPTGALDPATGTFTCPVCLEELPASSRVVACPRGHGLCRGCLRGVAQHASSAKRAPIPCVSCGDPLDGEQLLNSLDGPARQRLDAALAEAAAGRLSYCANPACREPFARTASATGDFRCPFCGTPTCTKCGATAHPGADCPGVEGDEGEQALERLARSRGWTRCPRCGVRSSKDSSWACNYARCVCGAPFCLRCGEPYAPPTGEGRGRGARNLHGTPTCQCGLYQR